jgi:hypothetical protein
LREIKAVRLFVSFASAVALFSGVGFALAAQDSAPSRLIGASQPLPRDGTYVTDDRLAFVVDRHGDSVRLRFDGGDEVFYLSSEAAPMGGRVLKYDTGAVALKVAGWGGVTLYTAADKNGLPAEYSDMPQNVDPPPIGEKDVKPFAAKLAQELSSREDFALGFAADWDAVGKSEVLRTLACDAMRNATYALESVAKTAKRVRLFDRIHIVRVVQGAKAGVTVQKGILLITIAPQMGLSARPSSLAIARAMQAVF